MEKKYELLSLKPQESLSWMYKEVKQQKGMKAKENAMTTDQGAIKMIADSKIIGVAWL